MNFRCDTNEWRCPGVDACVNVSKVCDGNEDCPNGKDEGFRCGGNECDDVKDCQAGCLVHPDVSKTINIAIKKIDLSRT